MLPGNSSARSTAPSGDSALASTPIETETARAAVFDWHRRSTGARHAGFDSLREFGLPVLKRERIWLNRAVGNKSAPRRASGWPGCVFAAWAGGQRPSPMVVVTRAAGRFLPGPVWRGRIGVWGFYLGAGRDVLRGRRGIGGGGGGSVTRCDGRGRLPRHRPRDSSASSLRRLWTRRRVAACRWWPM